MEIQKPDTKEAVLAYIRARQKSDAANARYATARIEVENADMAMQKAWRACRVAGVRPGVYAFRETGRTCLAVTTGDYPALLEIVE